MISLGFFVGLLLSCLLDFFTEFFCQRRAIRKCKYDCITCKNWRCSYHYCQMKRLGLSRKAYRDYLHSLRVPPGSRSGGPGAL